MRTSDARGAFRIVGLPPGRYECVLTALDAKNRQRSIHRWIQVLDDGPSDRLLADAAPSEGSRAAGPSATAIGSVAALAPSADMAGAAEKPLVAGVKAAPKAVEITSRAETPRVKRQITKRPVRGKKAGKADKGKAARTSEPKAAAAAPETEAAPEAEAAKAPAKSAPGDWVLNFNKGTYQLTPAAEKLLAKAAAEVPAHPLENLRVTGHSGAEEADGAALAGQRAKMVASILVNRYQVESKRIFMTSAASGAGAKVDLAFARTE